MAIDLDDEIAARVAAQVTPLEERLAKLEAGMPVDTAAIIAGNRFYARLHAKLAELPPADHAAFYDSLLVD